MLTLFYVTGQFQVFFILFHSNIFKVEGQVSSWGYHFQVLNSGQLQVFILFLFYSLNYIQKGRSSCCWLKLISSFKIWEKGKYMKSSRQESTWKNGRWFGIGRFESTISSKLQTLIKRDSLGSSWAVHWYWEDTNCLK